MLAPTRGRPAGMQRVYDSLADTTRIPGWLSLWWYVDEDDLDSARKAIELNEQGPIRSHAIVGPRQSQGPMNQALYDQSGKHDIYFLGSDDIVFETRFWDQKVRASFERHPDRIVLVHGDDGVWDGRFGVNSFVSREWIETVGRFVPDYQFGYLDNHLTEVADRISRRVYLPDVKIYHMHPRHNRDVPLDQTYLDRQPFETSSRLLFLSRARREERVDEAQKLLRRIAECKLQLQPA